MSYGYFDAPNREYVITEPRTPVKWINYIGTRAFGGFVDHTGGALICKGDPTFNRITKYLQQMPASDLKGETLYLRLHTASGYKVFSPFFVPTLDELESYACHVGLGYTHIVSEALGLRTEVTIFVPRDQDCEVRDIRVTNISTETIRVDVIPVVEYTHPHALQQFTNADWVPQTMQSRQEHDGEFSLLLQYPFMHRETQLNYFTSNRSASSFETDRKQFLGENEYGSFRAPVALQQPELGNHQALRGDSIAALLHPIGELAPGESQRLITQLGQGTGLEEASQAAQRFRDPQAVDAELDAMRAFWDGYLATLQVQSPDEHMDLMLNLFNPYQCYVTRNWSRYLSYYQLGLGSRGIGIRDSSQDLLAVLPQQSAASREFVAQLLSYQRQDGSALHQFNPLTLEGSQGDALEMEDRPHYYSDDHLWTIWAVVAYLKESGDFGFLDETIPYYEKDKQGQTLLNAPVLEHIQRGLAFTQQDLGSHGLPLLGFADWNDTVNLPTGAESLFTANLYGRVLQEVIGVMRHLGDEAAVDHYQADYESMRASVESAGWDGAWYLRYFDEEGSPLGSARNTYGQIYLNAQTWPVISGFAAPERARQAMDAVYEELNTPYGIKLSTPGFDGYDPKYGGVTTYPPGAKENGGIFLHPNPWAMMAECLLGNGDRAYQYYAQINPAAKNDLIDLYECEPYVYAQNILGDEHPQFGLARNSWLSGTAAWSYLAATQWILGLQPDFEGLTIDPCIPSHWPGFTAQRSFRGTRYTIRVHNPEGLCRGISRMLIDGQLNTGNQAPAGLPGGEHEIEIWLGPPTETT